MRCGTCLFGAAEIWISNIAVGDRPAYRALGFADGEVFDADGASVQVSKDADTWSVIVSGNEHYPFADALTIES